MVGGLKDLDVIEQKHRGIYRVLEFFENLGERTIFGRILRRTRQDDGDGGKRALSLSLSAPSRNILLLMVAWTRTLEREKNTV